ncbi:MAG: UDP-N-acetylglucosamine 1-carboxyvinyltransferase [Clostridiales bacterium]|jgi:UDP-N-acetylglucosamine 1-carboxyvinyltransferase|nr:UDP-N-acetylglucosamine 1-carboxyvinyltransferase [Clostridiales bacterium]
MEHIVITGQKKLSGEVFISGAKNASVAIIPAAICADGVCIVDNLPHIEDVSSFIDAITKIGVQCELLDKNTIKIDASTLSSYHANFDSVRKMRASYYLIGALLGRFKKAEVALPGGCNFGSRPIDQHIKGFEALGATVKIEHGLVKASAEKLTGAHIYLDMASVGATINIMFAAVYAEGVTTIENAAKEPHIVDTANFLNTLGAKIKGAGTDVIKITGVKKLHGGEYTIIPDQIEAGTYMVAAAITGGDVTIRNIIPKHMDSVSAKLREINCVINEGDDYIQVIGSGDIQSSNVKTMYYPGFPTDLQPQVTALLTLAKGTSIVTETVFENRFQYINELKRLGAEVTVDGRIAVIEGVEKLTGAEVTATDLRAGASLVVAALAAEGKTTISNVKYIDRGYEDIENKLRALGAQIERVTVTGNPD